MEAFRGLFFDACSRSRAGDLILLATTFLLTLVDPFNHPSAVVRAAVTVGGHVLQQSDADPSLHVLGFASQRNAESASVRLDRHPIFRVPPIRPRASDTPPRPVEVSVPLREPAAVTNHRSLSNAPASPEVPPAAVVGRLGLSDSIVPPERSPSSPNSPGEPRVASRVPADHHHPGRGDLNSPSMVGDASSDSLFPTIEPPRQSSPDLRSVTDASPAAAPPRSGPMDGMRIPQMEVGHDAAPVPALSSAPKSPLQVRDETRPVGVSRAVPVPASSSEVALPVPEVALPVPALGAEARVPAAVADRARQGIEEGIRLAERGAMYSARARFVMALRLITQSLDARTGGHEYSQSLANGLQALEEAADFQPPGTQLEAQLNLPAIVSTHRTPVLQQEDLRNWTAMAALQRYHVYAEQQLTRAGGRELAAADALYGLARLQPYLAAEASNQAVRSGPIAMSLYQAALMVEPQHYLAANELGALFARYGQWREAREALRHAVAVRPDCPVLWENLARVHDQLGERDLAQLALHEWQVALNYTGQPAVTSPAPKVQWVDAGTFAELSPNQNDAPHAAPFASGREQAVPSDSARTRSLPSDQDNPLSVGQRNDGRTTHGR